MPNLQGGQEWTLEAEPYRKRIEGWLEANILPDLGKHIVVSRVTTPLDFRDRLNPPRRGFRAGAPADQSAWFRPHNRSEEVENLFLVGAGVHPGAGLPGVLSSARVLDKVRSRCIRFRLTCDRQRRRPRSLPRIHSRRFQEFLRRLVAAAGFRAPAPHSGFTPSAGSPTTPWTSIAKAAAVARLRQRLDRAYAGKPADVPADRAFADLVRAYRIPRDSRRPDRRVRMGQREFRPVPTFRRTAGLFRAGRLDRRGDDDPADARARPPRAGARLRSRRRHAAHQHRARCRRGCPRRAALPARRLAGRGRRRRRSVPGEPRASEALAPGDRATARGGGPSLRARARRAWPGFRWPAGRQFTGPA